MNRKVAAEIVLMFLLVGVLTSVVNIQPAKAIETIYIRPDGSVDPPTAPILRVGDVYTLTNDIQTNHTHDGIIIQKADVIVEGAYHTISCWSGGCGSGIAALGVDNVTIRDVRIVGFNYGILLNESSGNRITSAVVTDCSIGINVRFSSNSNRIFRNTITYNWIEGIRISFSSSKNVIQENSISDNDYGINLLESSNNTICKNSITNNMIGTDPLDASNNTYYHNNFMNNGMQAFGYTSLNTWDNGYPFGGNYWSDYLGTDLKMGPSQNITGSDGIGDTPYVINVNNTDDYPLMEPWELGNLSVSVFTDKETYSVGETLHLGLNLFNPDSVKYRCFVLALELPDGTLYPVMHQHSVILPIGMDYSNPSFQTFTLPSLPVGIYTWHVAILDRASHAMVVHDSAEWEFS